MALEMMYQTYDYARALGGKVSDLSYRLRDVKFQRALVFQDISREHEVMTTLAPCRKGSLEAWHEFNISSRTDSESTLHCHGLIRINNKPLQGLF